MSIFCSNFSFRLFPSFIHYIYIRHDILSILFNSVRFCSALFVAFFRHVVQFIIGKDKATGPIVCFSGLFCRFKSVFTCVLGEVACFWGKFFLGGIVCVFGDIACFWVQCVFSRIVCVFGDGVCFWGKCVFLGIVRVFGDSACFWGQCVFWGIVCVYRDSVCFGGQYVFWGIVCVILCY